MRINPHVYGIEYTELQKDPTLEARRRALIMSASMSLDKAKMMRFNQRTMDMNITDLGRTASHFYIKYDTVETFNELMKPFMNESELLAMMSQAQEFQQLKVRDDELEELDELREYYCKLKAFGGSENVCGKVSEELTESIHSKICFTFSFLTCCFFFLIGEHSNPDVLVQWLRKVFLPQLRHVVYNPEYWQNRTCSVLYSAATEQCDPHWAHVTAV